MVMRSDARRSSGRSTRNSYGRRGTGGTFGRSSSSAASAIQNAARLAASKASKTASGVRSAQNPQRPTTPSAGGNYAGGHRPRPRTGPSGGGSSGGGFGGGGGGSQVYGGSPVAAMSTGVMSEVVPAPQPLGFDQFKADGNNYNKDAAYTSETATAESDYKNLIDQLTRQNRDYTTNFESNLRNMGLDFTGQDYGSGTWDPTDKLGAYGQSYGNLENDFSGRGMLDSSFYGQAQNDLTGRFNRQRTSLMDALGQENSSFNANKTAAGDARTQAMNRALSEAYNRYVAGFGL